MANTWRHRIKTSGLERSMLVPSGSVSCAFFILYLKASRRNRENVGGNEGGRKESSERGKEKNGLRGGGAATRQEPRETRFILAKIREEPAVRDHTVRTFVLDRRRLSG